LQYFRQAIALDPSFAEAYVGVADCYGILAFYAVLPPREAFPAAKEATKRALELDDGLAEAHATLGFINFYYDWNAAEAAKEFQRSLTENPNYATAHSWFSVSLAAQGKYSEADAEAHRALEYDPLSPIIGSNAGWAVSLSGNADRAIEILKKTIEIDPGFARAHFRLGRAYEQKKDYTAAIAELRQAVSLSGGEPCHQGSLGHVLPLSGKTEEARQILQGLEGRRGQRYVPSYGIALVYAGLGDNDQSIHWLQRAYEDRSTGVAFLRTDPELASLHSDPRSEALVHGVGF
jgi:tetratricopeptide (TPR) repeat protein